MRLVAFFYCLIIGGLGAFEGFPPPGPTTPVQQHWAFKMPSTDVRSIDRLIKGKLVQAGLSPMPPAGRQVLVRRAFHVLTGLLPSKE